MRRRLSTGPALLVVALALVAGTGTGVAGHALSQPAPTSGRSLDNPTTGAGRSTGSASTAASGILGAGNVLAPSDFAGVGWRDVVIEVETSGEPQYLYSCERRQLSATGFPDATIDASWSRQHSLSAGETVAQLNTPPQAESLFAALTGWYDRCTPGRPGSGPVTPSTRLGTVTGQPGVARIWRVGRPGDASPTYAILAREGDRLCLVDLYSDLTPPDPAGLRTLARHAIDRLR